MHLTSFGIDERLLSYSAIAHELRDVLPTSEDRERECREYTVLHLHICALSGIYTRGNQYTLFELYWHKFWCRRRLASYVNTFLPLVVKDMQHS